MALFAPMPSASVRMAVNANAGLLRSVRRAKRRSCSAVCSQNGSIALLAISPGFSAWALCVFVLSLNRFSQPLAYNCLIHSQFKQGGRDLTTNSSPAPARQKRELRHVLMRGRENKAIRVDSATGFGEIVSWWGQAEGCISGKRKTVLASSDVNVSGR